MLTELKTCEHCKGQTRTLRISRRRNIRGLLVCGSCLIGEKDGTRSRWLEESIRARRARRAIRAAGVSG